MEQQDDLWMEYIDEEDEQDTKHKSLDDHTKSENPSDVSEMATRASIKQSLLPSYTVADCPPSLRLLVNFYRWMGYSFSGLLFAADPTDSSEACNSECNIFWRKWLPPAKRLLLLLLNLLMLAICLATVFIQPSNAELNTAASRRPAATDFVSILRHEMTDGIAEYRRGFAHFKPILRAILTAVIYVFSAEGVAAFTANLLFGGQLIRSLTEVSRLVADFHYHRHHSSSNQAQLPKSFTVKLIACSLAFSYGLQTAGMLLFAKGRFVRGIAATFGLLEIADHEEAFQEKRLLVMAVMHSANALAASLTPALFLYTMTLFQGAVRQLEEDFCGREEEEEEEGRENKKLLTEADLQQLKSRLAALAEHFRRLLALFGAPVSIVNISAVYQVTACSCFLMVSQQNLPKGGQEEEEGPGHYAGLHYNTPLMFNFLAFSLLRLGVLCYAGSLIGIAAQQLLRRIYEHLPAEPSLQAWMLFAELKRQLNSANTEDKEGSSEGSGAFRTTLCADTYSVRQSSMLPLLGFALSYTVVLLQTENYGGTGVEGDFGNASSSSFTFNSSVQQQQQLPNLTSPTDPM